MRVIKTDIDGVLIVEPEVFGDSRGYFMESYSQRAFDREIAPVRFVQDNRSSSRYGVVRGLHYQKEPYAQSKLVSCIVGKVLDVAVDIREGSPTYGKHVAVELSAENKRLLFIPKGFAHGFAVLSDEALFEYKCDEFYHPEAECGIAWDDPNIGIDWRLPKEDVILSKKDATYKKL
jgi:dTDP-4-dehydrorhamnose 3,5-epimerase